MVVNRRPGREAVTQCQGRYLAAPHLLALGHALFHALTWGALPPARRLSPRRHAGGPAGGRFCRGHADQHTFPAEALTCAVALGAYVCFQRGIEWSLTLPLMAGALLSVPLATATVRHLPETAIRRGVGLFTLMLGEQLPNAHQQCVAAYSPRANVA